MIAILGGLGAAVVWAADTLCGSRTTRMIGATSVVTWVMLVGLVVSLPPALETGPGDLSGADWAWLIAIGLLSVLAVGLSYAALGVGKVGVIAPVLSTEGAIAAIIAVVFGERLRTTAALALAMIAAGVFLVSRVEGPHPGRRGRAARWPVAFALLAALTYGVTLYVIGRASRQVPLAWLLLAPRIAGLAVVGIPLLILSRLRLTSRAAPLVLVSGLAQVSGLAMFAVGARSDIAIASVIGSQFAALAALGAFLLFRERLSRLQIVGFALLALGMAVVSAVQA